MLLSTGQHQPVLLRLCRFVLLATMMSAGITYAQDAPPQRGGQEIHVAPEWLCDSDSVAAELKDCLQAFRAAKISGFFLLETLAPGTNTNGLCGVVDEALGAWGSCMRESNCIGPANEEWLTKSCEDQGLVYSLLALSTSPPECQPDCSHLFPAEAKPETSAVSPPALDIVPGSPKATAGYCTWGECNGEEKKGYCSSGITECAFGCGGKFCFYDESLPPITKSNFVNISQQQSEGYCTWETCNGESQGGSWCNANVARCTLDCSAKFCFWNNVKPPMTRADYLSSLQPRPKESFTEFCSWQSCDIATAPQGGERCNKGRISCVSGCGANWCTSSGSAAPAQAAPASAFTTGGYCSTFKGCAEFNPVAATKWCSATAEQCVTGCRGTYCYANDELSAVTAEDVEKAASPESVAPPPLGYCSYKCGGTPRGGAWCSQSKGNCELGCKSRWCKWYETEEAETPEETSLPQQMPLTGQDMEQCSGEELRLSQQCWVNYALSLPNPVAQDRELCAGHKVSLETLVSCLEGTPTCLDRDLRTGIMGTCRSETFLPQCNLGCDVLFEGGQVNDVVVGIDKQLSLTANADSSSGRSIFLASTLAPQSVQVIDSVCPSARLEECVAMLLRQELSWNAGVCEWAANMEESILQCSAACLTESQQNRRDYESLCSTTLDFRAQELIEAGCPSRLCSALLEPGSSHPSKAVAAESGATAAAYLSAARLFHHETLLSCAMMASAMMLTALYTII